MREDPNPQPLTDGQKAILEAIPMRREPDQWALAKSQAATLEAIPRREPAPWQPIETAPKDARILLWGNFWNDRDRFQYPLIGMWNPNEDRWVILAEFRFGVRPTHWMPLPAAPTAPTPAC